MVLILTPRGNDTHPCAGLEAWELSRPPMPQHYVDANLGLFFFYLLWNVAPAYGIYTIRQHPRFAKVRPAILSWCALSAGICIVCSGTLAFALSWPCWFMILAQGVGVGFVATTTMGRTLVLLLESQYAQLASKQRVVMDDHHHREQSGAAAADTDSVAATSVHDYGGSSSVHGRKPISALWLLVSMVYGNRKPAELTLQEVVVARAGYVKFMMVYGIPSCITIAGLILSVPQTYRCGSQCSEIFLEVEIGFAAVVAYYMVLGSKMLWLTYTTVGFDDKGVFTELLGTTLGPGSLLMTTMALAVADPHGMAFNREFNWQCLTFVVCMVYVWFTFGWNFIQTVIYDQQLRREDAQLEQVELITKMTQILESSPDVRAQFEAYALTQYVAESVAFLADVHQFKQMYYAKGESWRAQKVRLLIRNYIRVGTDMEINISSAVRDRVLQREAAGKVGPDAYDIFDEAYDQVRDMLQHGAWRDFVRSGPQGIELPPPGPAAKHQPTTSMVASSTG